MIEKKRLLRHFLRMVKIDSLSLEEGDIAKYVKAQLRKLGLKVREDRAGDYIGGESGNILAVMKGNVPGAPKIFLNAHLDTVSPGKKIRPIVRRGYVYSDGTTVLGADNKAGVAVILEAARDLSKDKSPRGDVLLLFTVAEEIGLYGAKNISRKFLTADYGLTLDGGDADEIINQAPSQNNIEAEVIGRAAHAGVHPEEGISAIKVASSAISKMKLGRIDPETTANIGIIKGGVATNIIPEKVFMKGEARSHDPKKLKRQISHMEDCLYDACRKYRAHLKIKVSPAYRSFFVDRDHGFLKHVLKASGQVGIRPTIKKTGGGSDANIFNAMGVPTIILGAGADKVHTTHERLFIDDMVRSAKLVLQTIRELSNVKK